MSRVARRGLTSQEVPLIVIGNTPKPRNPIHYPLNGTYESSCLAGHVLCRVAWEADSLQGSR
ncbi:hypothetical protein BN2476_470134 [Paraburkholderia piptadeniae]|uniref:Uncharacterized protein n=1 Tax=Paraburkholderia piptadeniae TaxID=1701573 RepID=A0A1N7SE77_9BURK|nr:hypothetical protein BN2476_470134 [Paraburkholderia piptadeniae]